MFSEKNVLDYYMHLNNLCENKLDEVEKLRILSEKEFKVSSNMKRELKKVIEVESYNYFGANSLIVWYLIKNGIKVETRKNNLESLMRLLVPTNTIDFLLNSLNDNISFNSPDGVVFKNNEIQKNFLKSRMIFLSTGGIQLNMGKERIIKLLCEAVTMDILRLMRYTNKLDVSNKGKNETNVDVFSCLKAKTMIAPIKELEKLKTTLSYLTEEYADESSKCKIIGV